MAWYKEVLPVIQVYAGNLADKEKKEGKKYSEDTIIKELLEPIGFDKEGKKLFFDILNKYRIKQKTEE